MDLDLEAPSTSLNPANASSLIEAEFRDVEGDSNPNSLKSNKGKQKQTDNIEDIAQEENQEWEWVEETEYIILDFGGSNMDANDLEEMASEGYSLIGLETPTPYFKAGIHTFKGFFEENAITEDMIFEMKAREETEEAMDDSDEENNPDSLDLVSIVTKRIIFEPIELLPKAQYDSMQASIAQSKIRRVATVEPEDPAVENKTPPPPKRNQKISIWKAAIDAVGTPQKIKRRPRMERKDTFFESGQPSRSSEQVLDQPVSADAADDKEVEVEEEEIHDVEME